MASLKVPPHNDELEQSVMASILIDKDAIGTIYQILKPGDLYNDTNGMVFTSMLA